MEKQIEEQLIGKKILFATVPFDGHFNPLTGLAKHLQELGCDVRWYVSDIFTERLKKLGIPHYTNKKAVNLTTEKAVSFEGRLDITDQIQKLNFDFINLFAKRGPEYYQDILDIHESFDFDIMIADSFFTGIPFVKIKMNKPVISIGIVPSAEDSVDLAPFGTALPPAKDEAGRAEYAKMHDHSLNVLFKDAIDVQDDILKAHGISIKKSMLPNMLTKEASLYLQIGTPGFEYKRSDVGDNVRFIGALLPYSANQQKEQWFNERLKEYKKIVLVTQGTVEVDSKKLIEPTLEAFKDTDVLVIVTTAGNGTKELREKYNSSNIIIEDYIPFNDVMSYANVYITNGGYGGTLLSINNQLPMVVAGLHEGKSEICARVGYFNLGINLNTEVPTVEAIRDAAEEVMANITYKNNVIRLYNEMSNYNSKELCVTYILDILNNNTAESELDQTKLAVN
jgi:MGT family glycosyltransferase